MRSHRLRPHCRRAIARAPWIRAASGGLATAAVVFTTSLGPTGCAAGASGPYTTPTEGARDTAKAQALTQRAATLMAKGSLDDRAKAEALLREALDADLYHGPAHNNLGVLYLAQGKLYEAASEFEWAKKLMPGHPDPRVNLALVLERAGRPDQALAEYDSALESVPHDIGALQGKARLAVRSGRADESIREVLEVIAVRGETDQWRQWATWQLTRMP